MPDSEPTKIFKFTLDEKDGYFEYDPPGNWEYNHTDRIRFQSDSGSFTIGFVPVSGVVNPLFHPLGEQLTSKPAPAGNNISDVSIQDGFTQSERQLMAWAHVDKDNPDGYITILRYAIELKDKKGKVWRYEKNGIYAC